MSLSSSEFDSLNIIGFHELIRCSTIRRYDFVGVGVCHYGGNICILYKSKSSLKEDRGKYKLHPSVSPLAVVIHLSSLRRHKMHHLHCINVKSTVLYTHLEHLTENFKFIRYRKWTCVIAVISISCILS